MTEHTDHQNRRSTDMYCGEHSNMMEQLKQLNAHFVTLLHPEAGILIRQKIKLEKLESFQRIQMAVVAAIGCPILGMLGVFLWQKMTGR